MTMKLEDVPTPECDLADEFLGVRKHYTDTAVAVSLERRLGLAVAALESIAVDSQERFIRGVAKEALAQIEEKK